MDKEIVKAFVEASKSMADGEAQLKNLLSSSNRTMAMEACNSIDAMLQEMNTKMANCWIMIGELKKIATIKSHD